MYAQIQVTIVMEILKENPLLKYDLDTVACVRRKYGLEEPARINEAIDILEEWLNKQVHIVNKFFPRDYLERITLRNKGSVERSKKKLDKLSTLRTLVPDFFEDFHLNDIRIKPDIVTICLLPKLTPDCHRVMIMKVHDNKLSTHKINAFLKLFTMISDYIHIYDYCDGIIYLVDFRDGNVGDWLTSIDVTNFRQCLDITFEGLSMRTKAINFLTSSKTINAFIAFLKPLLSQKIGERIQVHASMDTIYKDIPKEILPEEYNGTEKSVAEHYENLLRELDAEDFKEKRREINKCRTNEDLRPKDKFNEEYMGMSGTFRNLSVD